MMVDEEPDHEEAILTVLMPSFSGRLNSNAVRWKGCRRAKVATGKISFFMSRDLKFDVWIRASAS